MDVAIGLPNAVPNTSGADLVEWARRAEAREFSSLGTIDRIVYPNYEPLIALAGAAAVTEKIGLVTSVLLGPLHTNAALLAKQALSLNALSNGRFTLGMGSVAAKTTTSSAASTWKAAASGSTRCSNECRRSGRTTGLGSPITALPAWSSVATPTSPSPVPLASARAGSPAALQPASTAAWSRS